MDLQLVIYMVLDRATADAGDDGRLLSANASRTSQSWLLLFWREPATQRSGGESTQKLSEDEAGCIRRTNSGKKVLVAARASVTAGFANDVEAVNQYAAVIQAPTANGIAEDRSRAHPQVTGRCFGAGHSCVIKLVRSLPQWRA